MSLILLRFARPQCLAATHLPSPEVGNGLSWPKPQCTCNAMVTSRPVATGGGAFWGRATPPPPPPPLKLSAPPQNLKKNPILVTLKFYFLVFNTTCKTQLLNNKFNQHDFIILSEGLTTLFQLPRCLDRIHIESFWLEIRIFVMTGEGVEFIFLKHENKVNTSGVTSNFGPPTGSKKWAPNLHLAL